MIQSWQSKSKFTLAGTPAPTGFISYAKVSFNLPCPNLGRLFGLRLRSLPSTSCFWGYCTQCGKSTPPWIISFTIWFIFSCSFDFTLNGELGIKVSVRLEIALRPQRRGNGLRAPVWELRLGLCLHYCLLWGCHVISDKWSVKWVKCENLLTSFTLSHLQFKNWLAKLDQHFMKTLQEWNSDGQHRMASGQRIGRSDDHSSSVPSPR